MSTQELSPHNVDVIVTGGSIAATGIALALSANGLRVALIDKGVHPRFALGESLLKPTVLWMRLLAERFGVPELNVLANVEKIHSHVAPSSGIKKCFGFVQHVPGSARIRNQWWSNLAVSYGEQVSEAHLFRQDIDSYLFHAATRKCELVLSGTAIEKVDIDDHQVSVSLENRCITGKYIVDCTGAGSILARQFDHREKPTRYRSGSRTIFTHMIGVIPFDECDAAPAPAVNWHEGTLHHLLDDAWIWVIPFDNHHDSVNPLVSVGVTFYGSNLNSKGESAESEWARLLDTYPALMRQFGEARPVRPWISTGTLQYSSTRSTGKRYCLLGASYGGIDALFSRGLLNTMQSIFLVSELLIDAAQQDSFTGPEFDAIDTLQSHQLDLNDLLTYGFYCCTGSSTLISWWLVIWIFIEQNSISHAQTALSSFLAGKEKNWPVVRTEIMNGRSIANEDTLLSALQACVATVEQYRQNQLNESDTQARLAEDCTPLAALGFNYLQFSQLLNKIVFHPQARVLMQVEYDLASLLDEIDKGLHLSGTLRNSALAMCIIKLLSTEAASQAKLRSNSGGVMLDLHLAEDAFRNKLADTAGKWITEPGSRDSLTAMSLWLNTLSYSDKSCSPDQSVGRSLVSESDPGWKTLLESSNKGRQMTVQVKLAGSEFELNIVCRQSTTTRTLVCTGQSRLLDQLAPDHSVFRHATTVSGSTQGRQSAA